MSHGWLDQEVEELLANQAPGLQCSVVPANARDATLGVAVLVAAEAAAKAIPLLWPVLKTWIDRHGAGKVTLEYTTASGVRVKAEYDRLTRREMDEQLARFPPAGETPVILPAGAEDLHRLPLPDGATPLLTRFAR